jgi:beta-glucosidase/6-phospho-beta-glucosidase/beta-galactosidase
MGWEIYPMGLLHVLRRFASYRLPLLITENGLATDDEELRTDVLAEHLSALAAAVEEGLDVRGYFHWTLVDNYEWALGTRPHFGLAAMDLLTFDRDPRPAAALMKEVCSDNAVTRKTVFGP